MALVKHPLIGRTYRSRLSGAEIAVAATEDPFTVRLSATLDGLESQMAAVATGDAGFDGRGYTRPLSYVADLVSCGLWEEVNA